MVGRTCQESNFTLRTAQVKALRRKPLFKGMQILSTTAGTFHAKQGLKLSQKSQGVFFQQMEMLKHQNMLFVHPEVRLPPNAEPISPMIFT